MRIGDYHQTQPDWRTPAAAKQGNLIGVELEVYHPEHRQRAADAIDNFRPGKHPAPLAERDGSIDQTHGVEIICPPIPLEDVKKPDGYMARLMRVLVEAGTDEDPAVGYGMHVNINLEGWSDEEKLMTQYFLNKWAAFGQLIGRRDRGFGRWAPSLRMVRQGGEIKIATHNGDRHCAAYIRRLHRAAAEGVAEGRVMEVRFPKSTMNMIHLHQTIDYVFAVRDWVRAAPRHTVALAFLAQVFPTAHRGMTEGIFLSWCTRHRPDMAGLLLDTGIAPVQGNRLEVMTDAVTKSRAVPNFEEVNLSGPNPDRKEQSLRLSALLGKSARLVAEQDHAGRIQAASVRATR